MATIHFPRFTASAIGCLFFYAIFLWVSPVILIRTIEYQQKTKISGLILPTSLIPGRFKIRHAAIKWRNQFELLSGTVTIRLESPIYDVSQWIVNLKGKNLKVKIGSPKKDLREIAVNQIDATVQFLTGKDPLIKSLRIHSPELQIEMQSQI